VKKITYTYTSKKGKKFYIYKMKNRDLHYLSSKKKKGALNKLPRNLKVVETQTGFVHTKGK